MGTWIGIDISKDYFDAAWIRDGQKNYLRAQNGESGHPSRLKAASLAGGIGAFGFQCNQVAGLIRFWPLLDSPLRPIRWQLSRSLSQMASAAPASPMTFPHFSMGT